MCVLCNTSQSCLVQPFIMNTDNDVFARSSGKNSNKTESVHKSIPTAHTWNTSNGQKLYLTKNSESW